MSGEPFEMDKQINKLDKTQQQRLKILMHLRPGELAKRMYGSSPLDALGSQTYEYEHASTIMRS